MIRLDSNIKEQNPRAELKVKYYHGKDNVLAFMLKVVLWKSLVEYGKRKLLQGVMLYRYVTR